MPALTGDGIELVARVDDAVAVGEELEAELADFEGEGCEAALAAGECDPERLAVGVDRIGHLDGRW